MNSKKIKILVSASPFCEHSLVPIKLLNKYEIDYDLNPQNRKLTEKEAKDIQIGASIMSTGGGGDYLDGIKAIEICEERNQQITFLGMEDVNPEGFYVTVGMIGSISEETWMPVEQEIELMAEAVKILEDSMNVKFEGIISPELGGITGITFAVAATLNIPMLDCDAAGRAVPLMDHTTFNIVNIIKHLSRIIKTYLQRL